MDLFSSLVLPSLAHPGQPIALSLGHRHGPTVVEKVEGMGKRACHWACPALPQMRQGPIENFAKPKARWRSCMSYGGNPSAPSRYNCRDQGIAVLGILARVPSSAFGGSSTLAGGRVRLPVRRRLRRRARCKSVLPTFQQGRDVNEYTSCCRYSCKHKNMARMEDAYCKEPYVHSLCDMAPESTFHSTMGILELRFYQRTIWPRGKC